MSVVIRWHVNEIVSKFSLGFFFLLCPNAWIEFVCTRTYTPNRLEKYRYTLFMQLLTLIVDYANTALFFLLFCPWTEWWIWNIRLMHNKIYTRWMRIRIKSASFNLNTRRESYIYKSVDGLFWRQRFSRQT